MAAAAGQLADDVADEAFGVTEEHQGLVQALERVVGSGYRFFAYNRGSATAKHIIAPVDLGRETVLLGFCCLATKRCRYTAQHAAPLRGRR
jgi:hypothetical protein